MTLYCVYDPAPVDRDAAAVFGVFLTEAAAEEYANESHPDESSGLTRVVPLVAVDGAVDVGEVFATADPSVLAPGEAADPSVMENR